MLWSDFVIGGGIGLLSDSEKRLERLWLHGSWSCSPSLREYYFSVYSNTPRATARPHWLCREFYTDRLPSPRTGRIGRALQGSAVTCCWSTSAMTRAAERLNAPMIRGRLIPGSINCRRTPSKAPVESSASCCARKQEAAPAAHSTPPSPPGQQPILQ